MNLKTLFLPIGKVFNRLMKCIPAIVVEVEKAMQDKKIDPPERKELAMKTIEIIAKEWGYKLNWIVRWIISVVIDRVSEKLTPKDITIPDFVIRVVKDW